MTQHVTLNRRGLLGAAAIGGLTVAGLSSLTACGSGAAGGSGNASASAKLKLPAYVPAKVAQPDLPGSADGLDPAYLRYPKDLKKSVSGKPGDGKKITALTETFTTVAPGMSRNGYWQELNKRLGSEFDMTIVDGNSADGYPDKFNTIIASGDIPDLVWFPPNQGLRKVPELLQAKFTDLTEHLSGDAVKKYPNLANLPAYAWKTAVTNGRIYGVAVAYGRMGQVYVTNEDFWKPVGGAKFDSADDFLAKCKDLLDVKKKKYPLEPAYANALHMFGEWFGVPNGWREQGGKLQHMYETAEYKAALEFAVKVRKANVFWPDTNLTTTLDKVAAGQIGAYCQSFPSFLVDMKTYDFPFGVIVPFAAKSGATPKFDLGYGSVGFTAIANSVPKSRVKTLLKVMDYLCAPFGTEERLFLDNGIEGVHYKHDKNGDILFTEKGKAEAVTTAMAISFLANGPEYIYLPGKPELAKKTHGWAADLMKIAQPNPTTGYYSDTSTNKGASVGAEWSDFIDDVIAGRKPLSDFDGQLKKWKSEAGDAMRKEYEKALSAAK